MQSIGVEQALFLNLPTIADSTGVRGILPSHFFSSSSPSLPSCLPIQASNSTSKPMLRMKRLTFARRWLDIAGGNVLARVTVSMTRSFTAMTSLCCWSGLAPMPMAARNCHTYTSSPVLTVPGNICGSVGSSASKNLLYVETL